MVNVAIKHLKKCGLDCNNDADASILYHSPGDFDEDNLLPLIPLCDEHAKTYPESYPPPVKL